MNEFFDEFSDLVRKYAFLKNHFKAMGATTFRILGRLGQAPGPKMVAWWPALATKAALVWHSWPPDAPVRSTGMIHGTGPGFGTFFINYTAIGRIFGRIFGTNLFYN